MKKILFLTGICLFTSALLAHEFWLQPEKFMYQPGENINTRFMVGENFEGENWSGNNARIQTLTLYQEDVEDDLSAMISPQKGDSLQFTCYEQGTQMIAFHSTNSFIQLEPAKFNDYLKEDGLANAIAFRKEHNEMDSAGKEYYQRSVKTLVQVGDKTTATFRRTTNLPLDIIPLSNPYALKDSAIISAKILFQKKPLSNALVNLWHRENNKTDKQEFTSNEKGELSFPVTTTGIWMISTVKMERLKDDPKANWQSYWGSLTWGYLK